MEAGNANANLAERKPTPRQGGYRMPAEWEPHEATWLAWPHDPEVWSDQLEGVKDVCVAVARVVSQGENVRLLVNDAAAEEEAFAKLRASGADMGRLRFEKIATVDVWIRDYGPTFVTSRQGKNRLAANKWRFNAWGEKYDSHLKDDEVGRAIAGLLGVPVFEPGLVFEGGSLEVNGRGTCLLTEQCLLNANRNPLLGRRDIERVLGEHLAVDQFIWLPEGLDGDDTDGHIDNLARFVNPTTIVCVLETDPGDGNYAALQANHRCLEGASDREGKKFTIVPIPQPGRVDYGGTRLPASYANFYITNAAVLVPLYHHPNDRRVFEILESFFPGRKVVGIPCGPLLVGLGAIHCMTQQEPAP
ncbi:MAG: agmatine deiminase family protein [Candidatus Binatia bacterium]|jgi:agmatine deiminase|nr:agmatine deiminase family protein [Candidatus Binatia bacterium]